MALKHFRFNLNRRNEELFWNEENVHVTKRNRIYEHEDNLIELENKLIDYLRDPFIQLPFNSIQLLLKFNLNNEIHLRPHILNDLLVKFANVFKLIKYLNIIKYKL